MNLDKLQESALIRIVDDDDAMRKSWRFLIEGEGWRTVCYSSALRFVCNTKSSPLYSAGAVTL